MTWRGIVLGVLLVAFWAPRAQAEEAAWWNEEWSARHALDLPRPGVEAVDAASAVISTFGRLQPDGDDLRVVTSKGEICPREIIEVGPGDQVSFLFETVVGERSYYAYFGNRLAEAPRSSWGRTAGLIVEVRDLPAGPYKRAPEITALWNKADMVQGRALVTRVFHGSNPVGPAKKFIARFVGFLRVGAKGAYRVVTTSSDASIVVVNGGVVAQWGGDHNANAGRRGQFGSTLDLEPGLHRVEYYWVKASAHTPAAVLGWQMPTDLGPKLVQPPTFVQAWTANVRAVEFLEGTHRADFTWTPASYIERNGVYAVAMVLRRADGLDGKKQDFHWSFADGSTAAGSKVVKVFFGLGPREVTLVAPGPLAPIEGVLTVDVAPPWQQTRQPRAKALDAYRHGFDEPDPEAASANVLTALVALADDLDRIDRIGALWNHLKRRPDARRLPGFARVAEVLGARFQRPPYCSADRAEEALRMGIAAAAEEETRLRCHRLLADLLVNTKGDADGAEEVLDRLGPLLADKAQRRLVRILEGDIAAARGAFDEAAAAYEKAGATARPWDKRVAVQRDTLRFSTADYLRRGEFAGAAEALDDWMVGQPTDRLDPHLLWLQARAAAGLGFRDRAFVLFERALGVDPFGAVAPRLLLDRADLRRLGEDVDGALADEETLLDRFPYSEEAARLHARRKGIKLRGGS